MKKKKSSINNGPIPKADVTGSSLPGLVICSGYIAPTCTRTNHAKRKQTKHTAMTYLYLNLLTPPPPSPPPLLMPLPNKCNKNGV